jgi:hypothetical protein
MDTTNPEPRYLRPLDRALAAKFDQLNDEQKEWFTERAATQEFIAALSIRCDAEARAWQSVVSHFKLDQLNSDQS